MYTRLETNKERNILLPYNTYNLLRSGIDKKAKEGIIT